ncbi:MAG TPA: hypothetical protein DEP69_05525, partial [Acidimicrobiaceae bacterium]|nr:hypothetical protein [Acidimicrobiaceae bacterium]
MDRRQHRLVPPTAQARARR